ncbi:aldose epimerase family protein [Aliidiomarina soli]|uniref:Aldose 1-epimerase n=1 Tax=Aliidiomarina soli TaxID=1928574 RepID=A0A432WFE2_9GAMM|nr:aldose epimerase family protein [Aliidiomarina soli]RUO32439.1 galactose-1-epimerase [Aliidiomarina soli]
MALLIAEREEVHAGFSQPLRFFTLQNSQGMQVTLANFGASVRSLKVPGKDGIKDITLNYQDPALWLSNPYYFGVIVGRCANRIGNSQFSSAGQAVNLTSNEGPHQLHGGPQGLSFRFWETDSRETKSRKESSRKTSNSVSVTFHIQSEDGDQGYPGNFEATVTYSLNEDNELLIEYQASTDKACPVNMTSHIYFNLAGSGSVLEQELTLHGDRYVEVDKALIPTGRLLPTTNSAMDFQQAKPIGQDIANTESGYDHFWVAGNQKSDALQILATLRDPVSGRTMELFSTEPGVQFYSGNFLDSSIPGASGQPLQQYGGLCLEPHIHPDAVNQPRFPSVMLSPGQTYQQRSLYKFSTT